MVNSWNLFDLIFYSILIWSFLLGGILIIIILYKSIHYGKKFGWFKKDKNHWLFEKESPFVNLILAIGGIGGLIYLFIIDGILFKYIARVELFFR